MLRGMIDKLYAEVIEVAIEMLVGLNDCGGEEGQSGVWEGKEISKR